MQLQPAVNRGLYAVNDHWLVSVVNARSASLGHSFRLCWWSLPEFRRAQPLPTDRPCSKNQLETSAHSCARPLRRIFDTPRCSLWRSAAEWIVPFDSTIRWDVESLSISSHLTPCAIAACQDRQGKEKYAVNKCQVALVCSIGGKEKLKLKKEDYALSPTHSCEQVRHILTCIPMVTMLTRCCCLHRKSLWPQTAHVPQSLWQTGREGQPWHWGAFHRNDICAALYLTRNRHRGFPRRVCTVICVIFRAVRVDSLIVCGLRGLQTAAGNCTSTVTIFHKYSGASLSLWGQGRVWDWSWFMMRGESSLFWGLYRIAASLSHHFPPESERPPKSLISVNHVNDAVDLVDWNWLSLLSLLRLWLCGEAAWTQTLPPIPVSQIL